MATSGGMTRRMEIDYPADLPIVARRDDLLEAIADHQVVVVAGETGSGKSTQLPKMCLELGRGDRRLIGHTQPRRLAARSVAARIAQELGSSVGELVGSTVRFDDRVGASTRLQVMTDGILLARIQHDPDLRRYDTLILDEAHERSLNIDFLLGYLARLLPHRPDLKLIVTSATIDTKRFAEHFEAPVIEVSGRSFPVEVRYRPFGEEPGDRRDQNDAICDALVELWSGDASDTLVFLSGQREIHDAADALAALRLPNTEILPLYARLSAAEQQRIFAGHQKRRIVLATNVAETSLTVPGIRSVVDVGTARISRYSRRLKVQRLPIEEVSRASADQRMGRCGRVAPGVCIRLYSEQNYEERPAFTDPEILRTNLASVILQMAALGLGEIADFPFVEPPDTRAITDGVRLLEELGAFDPRRPEPSRRLTELGRRLARLPLDPRLGRMILRADEEGCVREVLIVASALAIVDPREYPAERRGEALASHRRFMESGSDFLAFLELWEHLRRERRARSGNAFGRMCRAEYLHHVRVREWQDLDRQLRKIVRDLGVEITSAPDDAGAIHRSVLAGLLSRIGMRDREGDEYRGARDARFLVTRDSALDRNRPPWLMVAELTETNRLWGRTAAAIEPEWAERIGAHLVKRSHGDPRWDERRGRAVCNERVTLFGLPVVSDLTVPYTRVDPGESRDLFILHGLVRGEIELPVPTLSANRTALAEARSLAERTRRADLVIDEHLLFDFYDERIGADVTSIGHFNRWWIAARAEDPRVLELDPTVLLGDIEDLVDTGAFPDAWPGIELHVPLTYEFDPSSATDGVMAHLGVRSLNQLSDVPFDWQVPGFRSDLVESLLRSLPKNVRRELVPIAETASAIVERRSPEDGPLLEVIAEEVRSRALMTVSRSDFRLGEVPRNLRMTFAVFGEDGRLVAAGKDLARLRDRVAGEVRSTMSGTFDHLERHSVNLDELGSIPERVSVDATTGPVVGWPALVDERGGGVALRVLDDPAAAEAAHRSGIRTLLIGQLDAPRKLVARQLPSSTGLALAGAARGALIEVLDDCIAAAVDRLVPVPTPRSGEELTVVARQVKEHAVNRAVEIAQTVGAAMSRAEQIKTSTEELTSRALDQSVLDVRSHLDRLTRPGLALRAGENHLPDLDRYLDAAEHRVKRLAGNIARDMEHMSTLAALEEELGDAAPRLGPELTTEMGWMLEELRVALFAQHLGTAGPSSAKRIRRAIAEGVGLR